MTTIREPTTSRIKQCHEYNINRVKQTPSEPVIINPSLVYNPFLINHLHYQSVIEKIKEYNSRVEQKKVSDGYEVLCMEKLFAIMSDLAEMEIKVDQENRMDAVFEWWKEQEKIIQQRKDQGFIRYRPKKKSQRKIDLTPQKTIQNGTEQGNFNPTYIRNRIMLPFRMGWRTPHAQIEPASKRLKEYKRKNMNIQTFLDKRDEKKSPRILYPKLGGLKYPEYQQEEKQQVKGENVGENQQIKPQNIQEEKKLGEEVQTLQQSYEQNLGLGEEPQEVEEQAAPEESEDKLAPKFKSYTIQFDGSLQREHDDHIQRRMKLKYLKIQQNSTKKQKEDSLFLEAHQKWESKRARLEKQFQKKLQRMKHEQKYSIAPQIDVKSQKLNPEEQIKYGFVSEFDKNTSNNIEINLNQLSLPKVVNPESKKGQLGKSIRSNRLSQLRNKLRSMLNLIDYQQRKSNSSICQHTSKQRNFSQILVNHSRQKERQIQLNEAINLKDKLHRSKVNVKMDSLSTGLCSPINETNGSLEHFPQNNLPSNPFFIEAKKKKKKK